jgi:hypothetical protein
MLFVFSGSMLSFVLLVALLSCQVVDAGRLTESERVAYWYARNNTWPPTWQKETEKYKRNMELREAELQRLPGADERWENYMQFTAARMVPRFTPMGFKVIQTPPEIQAMLKKVVDDALLDWDNVREESRIDVLYTPTPSKFIDVPRITAQVHKILQPLHEEWVGGMKLKPTSIYGIRANRNGSSLIMHYDKVLPCSYVSVYTPLINSQSCTAIQIQTHVISSIVHIAHEYFDDNHPWPIEIEDHDGELHAVNLEPGQVCTCYCILPLRLAQYF